MNKLSPARRPQATDQPMGVPADGACSSCFAMLIRFYAGRLRQRHKRLAGGSTSLSSTRLKSQVETMLDASQDSSAKQKRQARGDLLNSGRQATKPDLFEEESTTAAGSSSSSSSSDGPGFVQKAALISSTARTSSLMSSLGSSDSLRNKVQVLQVESDQAVEARQKQWLREQAKLMQVPAGSRHDTGLFEHDADDADHPELVEEEVMRPQRWFSCNVCKDQKRLRR
mmetsp:Transcript_85407/g.151008  ORF Transcript_85407/g.151008 Transcript_85407/m.151008 type:complete len:227 (-) Transcript_85407:56-736(-)